MDVQKAERDTSGEDKKHRCRSHLHTATRIHTELLGLLGLGLERMGEKRVRNGGEEGVKNVHILLRENKE